PSGSAQQQQSGSYEERDREGKQASAVIASPVFNGTEQRRQEEAAEAAGRAHQSGNDAHVFGEALRNKLENSAIAHAEHSHAEEKERHDDRKCWQRADYRQAATNSCKKTEKQAVATDAVRNPATHGAEEAAGNYHDRGEVTGADFGE